MLSRLHPMVKTAIGLFLAEFFISSPAQQLYQWLTTKWAPAIPDYIPAGFLSGIGIGLIVALYYLRHDEPGWWQTFDLDRRKYENETISMRAIARACYSEKQIKPVRRIEFKRCRLVGPDMAAIFGGTRMVNNSWADAGTPIELRNDVMMVGAVAFLECEFDDCTFERIQPIFPAELYAAFMANIQPPNQQQPEQR